MTHTQDNMDPEFRAFLSSQDVPAADGVLSDEDPPEPVDAEKIRAFYRRELSDDENEWVAFLITRYRQWHEADIRVALEESEGTTDSHDEE